jgi:hypothetical protein
MKIVRGRKDAQELPSRHNFALFRLAAWLRVRKAEPEPADVILIIDRHQSAFETYTVSVWVLLTLTCYVAATLFSSWPVSLAIAAALPVAVLAVHAPFTIMSILLAPFAMRDATHLRVQSASMMLILLATSAWFATRPTWARFAAWQFLGLAALNAVAAAIVFLLRGPIAQMEDTLGGSPSES